MEPSAIPTPFPLSFYVAAFDPSLEAVLDHLVGLGVTWVGTHGLRWRDHGDLPPARFQALCLRFAEALSARGMAVSSCHAVGPHFGIGTDDAAAAADIARRDLEGFAQWHPRAIVCHPYWPAGERLRPGRTVTALIARHGRTAVDAAVAECLARSADEAARHGLRLALENMPRREGDTPWPAGTSVGEMTDLVQRIARANVGVCWDSGHSATHGHDLPAEIARAGGLLFETHLHDNQGALEAEDQHLPPGLGVIDWRRVVDALWRIGFRGPVTFEAGYGPASRPIGLDQTLRGITATVSAWRMFEELAAEDRLTAASPGAV